MGTFDIDKINKFDLFNYILAIISLQKLVKTVHKKLVVGTKDQI